MMKKKVKSAEKLMYSKQDVEQIIKAKISELLPLLSADYIPIKCDINAFLEAGSYEKILTFHDTINLCAAYHMCQISLPDSIILHTFAGLHEYLQGLPRNFKSSDSFLFQRSSPEDDDDYFSSSDLPPKTMIISDRKGLKKFIRESATMEMRPIFCLKIGSIIKKIIKLNES